MPSKNKDKALFLERMSSTCADKSSPKARIAMISLFGDSLSSSIFSQKLLLLLEYLQLLSPILLFALFFQQKQETSLPENLLSLARLINPGLWISFTELKTFEILILIGLLTFKILQYLLLLWIIYKFRQNSQPQKLLIKVWRTLFNIQGRVLYFYMTFFWVNMAMVDQEETRDKGRVAESFVVIILDFAFSLLLYTRYHYMLPMKNFLSGKDNVVEMITLIQKFVLQVLMVFLPLNSQSSVWIITVINTIADLIRNLYFFKTLPLYDFQALDYQGTILMILSSINLACLVSVIGKSIDSDIVNLAFFMYLWGLISLLTNTISKEYLRRRFWKIICDPSVASPSLLIHRIPAINQLKNPKSTSKKVSWMKLAKGSVNKNLKDLLKITKETGLNINDKKSAKTIFANYLEKLLEIYPNNEYIQLYAAHYFVKKYQRYGDAVKTVTALRLKGSNNNIKLNAELLLIQIQNELQERSAERNRESQIDPTSYLQEQGRVFQLQSSMLEQANAQIKVCGEIKKNAPDTFLIHRTAQIFNKLRGKNIQNIRVLFKSLSESNLKPLLLYAHYFLSLNHSLEDYSHYLKIYSQRFQKYQRYFDQQDLCQKNLFQASNGLYLLSGQKGTAGDIIFSPKPLGVRQGAAFSEANIISRTAPCLRNITAQFYQHVAESYDETFFNKTAKGHIYHQDGYLIEVIYHLNIHPYVTQGFYFVLFLRPIVTTRDLILILENGDIDCGTKNVSEKLGFLANSKDIKMMKNIKNLSEELLLINKAFNMVTFPQKNHQEEGLTMEAAQELYDLYTTKGRDIWLSSLLNPNKSYLYHCKVVNENFGSKLIKTLILEESGKGSMSITTTTRKEFDETESCEECCVEKDEKEQGWIDFEPLTSRKKVQTLLIKSEEETYTDSRKTQEEGGTSRFLTGFPAETERKPLFVDTAKKSKRKIEHKYQEKDGQYSKKDSSWYESRSKESSKKKKLARIFVLSLESKHDSKVFKGLNILLYLALLAFLASQFIIMAVVKDNLDSFKAQKNVLRTFQLRNFFLISLEGTVRVLYDVGTGAFNTSGIRSFARGTAIYKALGQQYLTNLTEMNQKLLLNGNLLNEEISSLLFRKDIPIYYTYFGESPQSYIEENTFGGIDRIITAGVTVVNYNGTNLARIKDPAQFVFRNSLDDILVKSQGISDTITSFLNDQRDQITKRVTEYFIIELVLMILLLCVFVLALWKQYKKEAKNLSALCRVSTQKIDDMLREFTKFKEIIEDQKSMSSTVHQIMEMNNVKTEQHNQQQQQFTREATKDPHHRGFHRNYYIFIASYFIFLAALVGLVSIGVTLTTELLESFKSEQVQIYLLDYMRTRAALSRQAARELTATNNTGKIENKYPYDEFSYLVDELKNVKSEVYTKLLNEETVNKIHAVKTVLLGDACGILDTSNSSISSFFCQILKDTGKQTGLVYLLGEYEDALITALNDYKVSDKTAKSLQNLQRNLYNLLPSYFNILTNAALALSDLIDAQLEKQLQENEKDKSDYLIACSLVSVVIGGLMWIFILRKLKEGVNQFKNVLKIFSAEVVLSSFILKVFLRKTSKYASDSFKF